MRLVNNGWQSCDDIKGPVFQYANSLSLNGVPFIVFLMSPQRVHYGCNIAFQTLHPSSLHLCIDYFSDQLAFGLDFLYASDWLGRY